MQRYAAVFGVCEGHVGLQSGEKNPNWFCRSLGTAVSATVKLAAPLLPCICANTGRLVCFNVQHRENFRLCCVLKHLSSPDQMSANTSGSWCLFFEIHLKARS